MSFIEFLNFKVLVFSKSASSWECNSSLEEIGLLFWCGGNDPVSVMDLNMFSLQVYESCIIGDFIPLDSIESL